MVEVAMRPSPRVVSPLALHASGGSGSGGGARSAPNGKAAGNLSSALALDRQLNSGHSGGMATPASFNSGNNNRRRSKAEVCESFTRRLRSRGDIDTSVPGFLEDIARHFERLPTRYALDVNTDGLDVLNHKRLLDEARVDPSTVAFAVRPVEILLLRGGGGSGNLEGHAALLTAGSHGGICGSAGSGSAGTRLCGELSPLKASPRRIKSRYQTALPRPAFGSSPNLQALALEAGERFDGYSEGPLSSDSEESTFFEVTIASIDRPKLLSKLSESLGDLNLNIREAHAFNSSDGFVLDVFVVDGWSGEGDKSLEEMLGQRLLQMPPPATTQGRSPPRAIRGDSLELPEDPKPSFGHEEASPVGRPLSPIVDDWEIDVSQLQIDSKIASGSFSTLYRGHYCGQEVAVKILKDIQDDATQLQEFLQEVSIMRKVRHKNVVQFIGACTRRPNMCIVFEYMAGGSLYDYLRREGPLKLLQLLKFSTEIARGMDYLHQRKIIHRDLKAANVLLDENGIVKIADFGVARMVANTGHMTAETGTYRWMAPEVIEHKPYNEKVDNFSFGVLLWEMITCRVPYNDMTPLQAAVSVVQKGLRPRIPPECPHALRQIMISCWETVPEHRPSFKELSDRLQLLYEATRDEERQKEQQQQQQKGGLLSKLRGK